MSYRKDVLEQKLKKVTDEIGYKSTVKYKASLIVVKIVKNNFCHLESGNWRHRC